MKQHHLSTKFLRFYILIGILGFFLITLGGSYMVEKHLEHSLSAALYTEAHNIASNEAVKSNISSSTVDTLQEHLCAISDFQDAVLWIINSNGEIIVSTQKNIDVRDPIPLEEFDASKWGSLRGNPLFDDKPLSEPKQYSFYHAGNLSPVLCSHQSSALGLQPLHT